MEIRRISSSECIHPIPGVMYTPSDNDDDHPFGESLGLPERLKEEGFIPPKEKPSRVETTIVPPFVYC